MRKEYGLLLLLALSAGCAVQEVEIAEPSPKEHVVQFTAKEMETRTAFGSPSGMSFPTLWTQNDKEVLVSVNNEPAQAAELTVSSDYKTATFRATFGDHSSYTFYAVSPASAVAGMSPSRRSWKVTIPPEQTPLAESCDEAAQILVAKTEELPSAPEELEMPFEHLTAYMSITLKGLPEGTEVSAVELTAGVPLVGDFYYDCESGGLTDDGASSTVTLKTDASGAVWAACAPVDLSGKPMTVTVITPEGNYVKKIVFPEGRKLTPGMIGIFSIGMSGIEPEAPATEEFFELVTDASTLQEGDEVIIATPQYSYALSTTQNTNNRGREAVVIDGDKIFEPSSKVQVLTLEGSAGEWHFKVSDGQYLYTTSSTNSGRQYLRTGALNQSSVFNAWSISVSGGNASISAKVSNNTTKYLIYNNSSSVFAVSMSAPGTGNSRVALYRKASRPVQANDPVLDFEEYGAYLASHTWTYARGTDHLSRHYKDATVDFAIISAPEDGVSMTFSDIPRSLAKGDAFTLTFVRKVGISTDRKGSYEVTVVKESGRKVWLSDGAGNGFIVKK